MVKRNGRRMPPALDGATTTTAEGAAATSATIAHPATTSVAVVDRVRIPERLAYGVGDIGGNLIYNLIASFLLFYLTNIVGLGAAIAGTLLLLGRVMDGTLDLIIGTLIDRTRTRWGKARPWILFATPVVAITYVLLFNVPAGLSDTGKEIYAFIFYFLCLGVGFVSSNLAYHTLLSVITSDSRTRVSLTVLRTFFAILTGLTVNVITLPIIGALGGGQQAWSTIALTYGIIAAVTFVILFLGTRERITTAISTAKEGGPSLRVRVGLLFRNRYFLLAFAFFFIFYGMQSATTVGVYFATDVLGDPNAYSLLALVGSLPLLVGIWFMGPLVSRFGKRRMILIGSTLMLLGAVIPLLDPTNFPLVLGGNLLRGIGTLPASAALFALVADVVDYGQWRTGVRLDGMTFAAATAGQNFGGGLGVAVVGWGLALGGYVGTADTQPNSATTAILFLQFGLPIIATLLLMVVTFFLNVDKHLPEIHRELATERTMS